MAQVNASSLVDKGHKRFALKLIKKGYISFIASDAHSVVYRPPLMDKAFETVKNNLGQEYVDALLKNSDSFYNVCYLLNR